MTDLDTVLAAADAADGQGEGRLAAQPRDHRCGLIQADEAVHGAAGAAQRRKQHLHAHRRDAVGQDVGMHDERLGTSAAELQRPAAASGRKIIELRIETVIA